MNDRDLGQLILYVIDKVNDLGGYTNTIRLVKLLYLIDLEHQRRHGKTLTGLDWVFHRYGPYASELPRLTESLGFLLGQEEFITSGGHRGRLYSTHEPQGPLPGIRFGTQVMVDLILKIWADQDTWDLLDYVYETGPMQHARRGDSLDFSIVPRGTRYYELYLPADQTKVYRLREALRSYDPDEEEVFVDAETVLDNVLAEGLQAIEGTAATMPDLSGPVSGVNMEELLNALPDTD